MGFFFVKCPLNNLICQFLFCVHKKEKDERNHVNTLICSEIWQSMPKIRLFCWKKVPGLTDGFKVHWNRIFDSEFSSGDFCGK